MEDIKDIDDIKKMVDAFYDKVNLDDLLSPVFNEHAKIDWDTHLPKMYKFWDMIIFNNPGFSGSPFKKHENLPVMKEHFDRWLELFNLTLNENFEGVNTEEARQRAQVIGVSFWYKIANQRV